MSKQVMLSISANADETDLKKKRREACRKSMFPMSAGGIYGTDWCDRFAGTPFHVTALELHKEDLVLDRKQAEIDEKFSYSRREKMTPIQRLKYDTARDEESNKLSGVRRDLRKRRFALEEKFIDHRLELARHEAASKKADGRVKKADNSMDVDVDAGHYGVEGSGGQMSMRVQANAKCNGCLHYQQSVSLCQVGLLPAVCGDGSHPELGYAPASGNRIAAKNWTSRNKGAVVDAPGVVADDGSTKRDDVPHRIDVLGDSSLSLSEIPDLTKGDEALAAAIEKHGLMSINDVVRGQVVAALPRQQLAAAEPIVKAPESLPVAPEYRGSTSLSLADTISRGR